MKRDDVLEDIKKVLNEDDSEKISFARHYLEENKDLTYELKAALYEILGEAYKTKRESGDFYKKAASSWEMHYITLGEEIPALSKRVILKKAYKDYRRSARQYHKAKERSLFSESKTRADLIKSELRQFSTPMKKVSISFVLGSLLLSFFFLAPNFTGLVVSPIDASESNTFGIVLMVLGLLGMVFVLWKWR